MIGAQAAPEGPRGSPCASAEQQFAFAFKMDQAACLPATAAFAELSLFISRFASVCSQFFLSFLLPSLLVSLPTTGKERHGSNAALRHRMRRRGVKGLQRSWKSTLQGFVPQLCFLFGNCGGLQSLHGANSYRFAPLPKGLGGVCVHPEPLELPGPLCHCSAACCTHVFSLQHAIKRSFSSSSLVLESVAVSRLHGTRVPGSLCFR